MFSRTTVCGMALATLLAAAGPASAQSLPKPDMGGAPPSDLYDYGVMGPPATPSIVAAASAAVTKPMAPGPVQPTWESVARNYQTPSWFEDAKFGIFMHWGLYSAAAHHNEWYEKHMYGADREWHAANFGPQETFGYKEFMPLFTVAKWDPDAWATLFKRSGARFVMPTAQHHDNFALWDSDVTRYNSVDMGPKRDIVGELGAAVRKQGMKYGVSNHGVENFTFINPASDVDARLKAAKADLYDPAWGDFYNVADRSPAAMERFLTDWVNRNYELIDKYHPDILWFDNGVNLRVLDPLKLKIAAYYYNAARARGQEVAIGAKYIAYAPSNDDTKQIGAIIDFEKVGSRSPKDIRPGPWMVDDTLTSTWGYTRSMTTSNAGSVLAKLIDTVSKGGFYLLNIAPMADGTIPQPQQDALLAVGKWLDVNGEAIYGTRPWTKFGEGEARGYRFTTKPGALYAIALSWPGQEAVITSLGSGAGKVGSVHLLGHNGALAFRQDETGLKITLPPAAPANVSYAYSFKIAGPITQPAR